MDLKREQLFAILEEAEGLGLPAPAGVVLKLFREETEELIKSIPSPQVEQIPIFSLMRSGLVPAPGQRGLTLKSDGWELVSTPLPLFTGGGGGSSGGSGGVTQHSLLNQLDYASAGHTGFQPTMTGAMVLALLLPVDGVGSNLDADLLDGNHAAAFQTALVFPLAPNLGGTGIANAAGSTLTLGAATSITGGGTIALGGFTGTVPATANFAMGAGTLSSASVNDATIAAHTHVITPSPALLGLGTSQYQVIVTGANPFPPGYSAFLLDGTAGGKTVLAVTNTKTLTLTCVDDYILTIPATGTAALLGVANVFTVPGQMIDSGSDAIDLRVQAFSTKTTSFVTFEKSDGTVLAGVDSTGKIFSYGLAAVTSNFITGGAGNSTLTGTNNVLVGANAAASLTSGGGNFALGNLALYYNKTGGNNVAIGITAGQGKSNNSFSNAVFIGAEAGYSAGSGVAGSVAIGYDAGFNIAGQYNIFIGSRCGYRQTGSNILLIDSRASALANIAAEQTNAIIYGVMAATVSTQTLRLNAAVTIGYDSAVALTVGVGTAGIDYQLNFDGETNDGLLTWKEDEDYFQFEDDVNLNTGEVLKVGGTQVVGARVIDDRCDDVINSGDATTDGVIDALRDAMIAHGLIAAA